MNNKLKTSHPDKQFRKPGRGGKRKGAGRKPKYSEPTTTIAFRVPESKVKSVTDIVKGVVNKPDNISFGCECVYEYNDHHPLLVWQCPKCEQDEKQLINGLILSHANAGKNS